MLGRFTGSATQDAFFGLVLSYVFDPEEMERQRYRRHAFLARYGYQSVLQWERVDGREVRRYAEALAGLLEEEAAAVKKAAAEAAAKG